MGAGLHHIGESLSGNGSPGSPRRETLTWLLSLEHLSFGISVLVSHPVFSWDPTLGFKNLLKNPCQEQVSLVEQIVLKAQH